MRGVRARSEEGTRGRRGGQLGVLVLFFVVVVGLLVLGLGLGSFLGLGIFVSFISRLIYFQC